MLYNTEEKSTYEWIEEFVNIIEFSTNSNMVVWLIGIASESPTVTFEEGYNLATEYGFYYHVLYDVCQSLEIGIIIAIKLTNASNFYPKILYPCL